MKTKKVRRKEKKSYDSCQNRNLGALKLYSIFFMLLIHKGIKKEKYNFYYLYVIFVKLKYILIIINF